METTRHHQPMAYRHVATSCIGFHTEAAIGHGATRDEIIETIGIGIYMGGGPSYVYGAQVLEAFDQLVSNR